MRERLVPYLPRLFGYAFSLTLDRDAARDLVQDCALRALEARRRPSDEAAFRAWLFTILRNRFIDQRRRAGRVSEVLADEPAVPEAVSWNNDSSVINGISVRVGLRKLSSDHRDILSLVDIASFSYGEAASVLDVPVGTVMSRISRARRALMHHLAASNVHAITPGVRDARHE